jgi:hypothetical protein
MIASSDNMLRNAQDFVAKLMAAKTDRELPRVQPDREMRVIQKLPILGGEATKDLIVREINVALWSQALKLTDKTYRVCIFGTPGIGKTTAIPHLIRFLLQKKKTVVFLSRSEPLENWYFEFKPASDEQSFLCSVYPEKTSKYEITSLQDKKAFYIVDPGATEDTCNPINKFGARVIIVASADSKHWGGSAFEKANEDDGYPTPGGLKLCYPVWSFDELLLALPYFNKKPGQTRLSPKMLKERYRMFGGVPRNVFANPERYKVLPDQQMTAITHLTDYQKTYLVSKLANDLVTLEANQPKGILLGYISGDTDFLHYAAIPVSQRVLEKVSESFMKEKWNAMISGDFPAKMFELYTIYSMMGEPKMYQSRAYVKSGFAEFKNINVSLGGCEEMEYTWDIIAAARNKNKVLFCPTNPCYPLIDFIYSEVIEKGKTKTKTLHFSAFQAITGNTHTHKAYVNQIRKFGKDIGDATASIYYLVPEERFTRFVTDPVAPACPTKITIHHISVPSPLP